jgi:hypothetical protein
MACRVGHGFFFLSLPGASLYGLPVSGYPLMKIREEIACLILWFVVYKMEQGISPCSLFFVSEEFNGSDV